MLASLVLGAASAAIAGQDPGTGTTFKWFAANDPFGGTPVYLFPTTAHGVHSGFYWPVTDPAKTGMFSGVGAHYFNQGLDNFVCWGYNANCTGPFNRSEHFFNIVLEGSYDEDPAAGTDFGQNWVEVNWNYGAAGATCPAVQTEQDGCWRPFGFILDEGLNSTRGGAKWFFQANDEDKGDNTSLALSWPWATFGARASHDMWYDAGVSSFTRSSTFDPGGTAYGIKGRLYLDHENARSGPHQVGFDMLTDYNSMESTARAGGVIGGRFTAKTSGWTDGRDAVFMDGLHVNLEATSTGTGMTLNSGYAIRAHHDFSGQNVTFGSTAGLYIDQPTAPGTFTTTGSHYGVLVENQRFDRGGMDNGQAIAVKSQTTSHGGEGNIHMAGGTHNTGHVQLANDHLWADTSNNRLRFKNDVAPTSATDGKYLVMGGTAGNHGPMGWAGAGVACATACSFLGGSCENAVCLEQITGGLCNQSLKQVACTVTDARRMCLCN